MKEFAKSVLYVSSIVVAVGIGMFQVGKESIQKNGAIDCPIAEIGSTDCEQISGQSTCGYTFSEATAFESSSNYREISQSQCGTYNSEGQFSRYPGCKSESLTPVSDGCGG